MLQAPEKSLIFEEVSSVLHFLQDLNLKHFTVYAKLDHLYEV